MMRCDHCRSLLLDHLYGLLEPADAAAVEEHLAGCPGCAAARDHEARAQGLIARAAKSEFPHVQFVAPAADVAPAALTAAVHQEPAVAAQLGARPEAEPATPGLTPGAHQGRPARRSGIIVGWAVAVSVLAGVAAAVLAVNGRVERANSTRDELVATSAQAADAEKALRQARHELTGKRERAAAGLDLAKRKHDQVLADWVTAEKATIGPAADRRLAVQVVKPAVIQPGAPNIFELTVLDTDRIVASTDPILAEVRDQTGKSVYAAQFNHDRQGRVGYLKLPAEVWTRVRPDDELFLAVATVDPKTGVKTDLQEPIRLFGPVYTTLLVTDRPSYRAGEPVYFRSLTLDRVTFRPPVHEQLLRFELVRKSAGPPVPVGTLEGSTHLVRVAGGKVEPVNGPDGKPLRGVGCGVFFLPPELPDGDYALTLTESPPPGGYPPAIAFPVTRTIQVRSGPAERYQKRIAFAAAGFAPGEEAEGWAELKSQDKPVPNVPVDVIAVVSNGVMLPVTLLQGATGPDGRVRFRVNLLKGMPPGEVRVKVTFQTPDRPEETAERVPLIGKNLIVEFFPEGGAMVAGVPCRVYVRATMPSGEPVDLRGVVTDGREVVVHVETLRDPEGGKNRGLGSFTFTPRLGGIYWLKLEAPAGPFAPLLLDPFPPREFPSGAAAAAGVPAVVAARTGFPLPPVAPGGVVMSVANPVTGPGQPFRVQLYSVAR
ncbi:MAG TPA: zf-HC2 domain-containing protein, partial [Gemmataceae bacterium]|nr:zf-HC2 domain-containing protein [Gemmataceae bacterium]